MGSISPNVKLPTWDPLGLYLSSPRVVSEESRHTSNPNSPRSSIESFPKLMREATTPSVSRVCAARGHPTEVPYSETKGGSQLLSHLCLLFCNVLPSVLLSILSITLTEAAKLLQRVVNYLQTAGTQVGANVSRSYTSHSPSSSTSNFHRTFSPRTPSVSTAKSELHDDCIRGVVSRSSTFKDHPEAVRSEREGLEHFIEELAKEIRSSQNLSEAENVIARHFIVNKNGRQRNEQYPSPPVLPRHNLLMGDLGQPPRDSWRDEKEQNESEQIMTPADEMDNEECQSASSSSSAALSTKCTVESTASLRHRDVTYESVDEAAPPSLDFISPLPLPLAFSPTTEKAEALSRVESPIAFPPPLSISKSLVVEQGEEEKEKEAESDRDTVDRDSLIGARRVLSTSDRSADGLLDYPPVSENPVLEAFQTSTLIEDYDSDEMIVPLRVMKSERKCPSPEEPILLGFPMELCSNEQSSTLSKQTNPEQRADKHLSDEHLSERDVRYAIEPVDDETVVGGSSNEGADEETKFPNDMSSIDREMNAYLKEKASATEDARTPFLQSRQKSGIDFSNIQDGQYSVVVRSAEPQTNRQNKLIPLQNVGRSQSSAEKPVSDWADITPYEADKESRLSRRHLSDLSFGLRERQKDMLPKELIPDDFPTDDESSEPREPSMERFRGNKWKRGIMAACRDVSECRKLVANLWKRKRSVTPIEAGLHGATGMHRVDSHRTQSRRNGPSEPPVEFQVALSQDTVFRLLTRLCAECNLSVVARKPNHKLKVTVRVPEYTRYLLLSIRLTRQPHTRGMGTVVVLERSREDQSRAPRKHIEITGVHLRRKLEENLEYIEDSFSSHLLEDSGL
ncbi:hypothetical protein FGB62_16g241 [Gracilaria domingensis]|nr:hypothetical protein FGB62_16g241 [Gracilaria domingensis]